MAPGVAFSRTRSSTASANLPALEFAIQSAVDHCLSILIHLAGPKRRGNPQPLAELPGAGRKLLKKKTRDEIPQRAAVLETILLHQMEKES